MSEPNKNAATTNPNFIKLTKSIIKIYIYLFIILYLFITIIVFHCI